MALSVSISLPSRALLALLGAAIVSGATGLAHADEVTDWKSFELKSTAGPPDAPVLQFAAQGSYRIFRRGNKFTEIEARIERGTIDIDTTRNAKLTEPYAPLKIQLVAGYRMANNALWMIPFHSDYAAAAKASSFIRLEKTTAAHYEIKCPVLSFPVAGESQDLANYVLFAHVFVTKGGRYIPAQSAKLQP